MRKYNASAQFADGYAEGATEQDGITRKEMIEKACEWLKYNIYKDYPNIAVCLNEWGEIDNFIECFRKAMEE